jgi:uncharacterized protein (TIGR02594 family)
MPEPRWLVLARADIGTTEIKGPKHNPKVLEYFKDVGRPDVKTDETAWCAAALGSWLKRAGLVIPPPATALAAISYETWEERLPGPALGAIGVKRRPGETWMRHVGIVVAANPVWVWMISGNASNRVGIDAFRREQFTAFRHPSDIAVSSLPLPSTAAGAKVAVSES